MVVVIIVVDQLNEVFENNSRELLVVPFRGIMESLSCSNEEFSGAFIFWKWVRGYSLVIKALFRAQILVNDSLQVCI